MKRVTQHCCWIGLLVLAVGCASGPKYAQMRNTIPALTPDLGRIYIYRTAVAGAAVQPAVKLNGEKVGTAKPKGFFMGTSKNPVFRVFELA